MSYPTYQYTTLTKLLNEVKLELQMDDTNTEDIYIIRYIIVAIGEMMTALDYVEKDALLNIDCFVADLPCDFIKFDRPYPLYFPQALQTIATNNWYVNNFNFVYNTGGAFFTCPQINNNFDCQWGVPTINVQDGKLYFSNNIDSSINQCAISYQGMNVDENGIIKVPAINARPIVAYACYKYLRTKKQPYTDFKDEWQRGKGHRKGLANLPDWFQARQAALLFNSLN
jgi:hypothetical protein